MPCYTFCFKPITINFVRIINKRVASVKQNSLIYFLIVFFLFFFTCFPVAWAADVSGRILLQVEDKGQAWYVLPDSGERVFLGRPADAFRIMRDFGLGVSEKNFKSWQGIFPDHLAGRIVLRVEAKGEAYYLDPMSTRLFYLGRPSDAFALMRKVGLGIKTEDLALIKIKKDYDEKVYLENNALYPVLKVVDGDTFDALINGQSERIRIIGIDTPEVAASGRGEECYGREASAMTKQLLENQSVLLQADPSQADRDKYGRLLRHVILLDGTNLGEELIRQGVAEEYTYERASIYAQAYLVAEDEARKNKVGMWGNCENIKEEKVRIVTKTGDSLIIEEVFYDGLENPNEADEYVLIKNLGDAINLRAYTLGDESGKIFVLPAKQIEKNAFYKIYTGCGVDTPEIHYLCNTASAIWNNSGDTAYLRDPFGELVSSYAY